MTVRAYRRTAQTETEDRNCTETSKQARNTQEKSQRKNVPKMAHDTVADQANNCTATSDRFKRFVSQRCRLLLVVNVKKSTLSANMRH